MMHKEVLFLYSTLISITISTIVLTLLLGIVFMGLCGMQN